MPPATHTPIEALVIGGGIAGCTLARELASRGVKTLVLSHFVPQDDPQITDQMWADAARIHFQGQIIVGRDLLEI